MFIIAEAVHKSLTLLLYHAIEVKLRYINGIGGDPAGLFFRTVFK